ncbi:MAG: hypothetical protein JXD23_05315 [Spirochaetales bacterium]|nr:hypothetical protein [Spirochaetales bacterium]
MGPVARPAHRYIRLIRECQTRPYTENKLLNLAVGFVVFAREEPRLYRFLHVERPIPRPEEDAGMSRFEEAYSKYGELIRELRSIPEGIQNPLILKTWIFTQGLAAAVSSGRLEFSEKKIVALLEEAGGAFYAFEEWKKKGGNP